MVHDHSFAEASYRTQMIDCFEFESPFGILGRLVDRLFLRRYMLGFLVQRNRQLKELGESEDWRKYIEPD